MTQPGHHSEDDLLRIVGDLGRVNAKSGLQPGTGAIRLELSPLQLTRLAQELSADAIQALGLALHFGVIRTDPIRVEILGWSRNWLISHGLSKHSAEKAARELRVMGLATVTYGPDGMFGPRLAVLNGGRFGWEKPVVEQVQDGRPARAGTPAPAVSQGVTEQVIALASILGRRADDVVDNVPSSLAHEPGRRADDAVDNPVPAPASEPGRRGTRADEQDPDGPVTVQVSALDRLLGGRADGTGTTSGVSEKKESLSSFSWSSGTLARTDLDRLLLAETLGDQLRARRSEAIAALSVAFADTPERASALLDYLDTAPGDAPAGQLAMLVVDLLALPSGRRGATAGKLLAMLRAKGAHVPAMAPDEFLSGLVLTLVSALASDVRQWNAWVVSGLKRDPWTTSAPLLGALEALTALATGSSVPVPAGGLGVGISVGVDGPTGSVDDPDYLADLRRAVAGTPDEDEVMFEAVLKNARRQALVLMRYQERLRKQAAKPDSVDAG